MDTGNTLLFAVLFVRTFPITFSSFQGCAAIFVASKRNLEWGKIMKKTTCNLCHPYKNDREDARNIHEIFLNK